MHYPSSDYSSEYARLPQFIDDALVGCNVRAMAAANADEAYVFEFYVGTAHHGSDVLYTFLNSFSVTSAEFGLDEADIAVAEAMQAGLTGFVMSGNPGISSDDSSEIRVLSESGAATGKRSNQQQSLRLSQTGELRFDRSEYLDKYCPCRGILHQC